MNKRVVKKYDRKRMECGDWVGFYFSYRKLRMIKRSCHEIAVYTERRRGNNRYRRRRWVSTRRYRAIFLHQRTVKTNGILGLEYLKEVKRW